jgi:hypothetical protein
MDTPIMLRDCVRTDVPIAIVLLALAQIHAPADEDIVGHSRASECAEGSEREDGLHLHGMSSTRVQHNN